MRTTPFLAIAMLLAAWGRAAAEDAPAATPEVDPRPAAESPAPKLKTPDDPKLAELGDQPPPVKVSRFSLRFAAGLAVSRGAGNASAGLWFDASERVSLGLDVEYSPWFDYLAGKASPGTINAYLSGSYRWFGAGPYEVRTAIFAGMSVLLFNTPGAVQGSVGVILGANILRAVARLSPRVAFEISPDAVLVVPSLRGVPLVYPQFRLTAGMRFSL